MSLYTNHATKMTSSESISRIHARVFVPCSSEQTIGEAQLQGLLTVDDQESEESVDPLTLLEGAAEVCIFAVKSTM